MSRSRELARIGCVSALAFFVLASYAVARPASESLFLGAYGSRALPVVWIAVAIAAAIVVAAYKSAAATMDLVRLFIRVVAISAAVLAALMAAIALRVPGATFLLYVWKDVYVVVLVELIWSLANTALTLKTARWANGLFCAAGQIGGLSANLGVGAISERIGTLPALGCVFPLLAITALVARAGAPWLATAAPRAPAARKDIQGVRGGLALLRKSPYLVLMLALIALVQIAITLVDYSFNATIEVAFPLTDARTAAIGRVYATIDAVSLALQLLTGPVLRVVGVTATLVAIPALLGAGLSAFVVAPAVRTIAIAKVASKAFDYSLLRAAKETLYLPLAYAEKTAGKALVDVLAYRVAKAGASLLLLGLLAVGAGGAVVPVTFATLGGWLWVTVLLVRRYAVVSHPPASTEELALASQGMAGQQLKQPRS